LLFEILEISRAAFFKSYDLTDRKMISHVGISLGVSVHNLGVTVMSSVPPDFFNVSPLFWITSLCLPLAIK